MNGTYSRRLSAAREVFSVVLLTGVCLAAVFPGVVFRGEMLSPASMLNDFAPWSAYAPPGWKGSPDHVQWDILNQDRPWYQMVQQALDAGEWPLWTNQWSCGMPLLANGQSAVFYPTRLLHTVFDVDRAYTLLIMSRLVACGLAAYVCGRGLRLRRGVCRFLCVAWMLASYNQIYCSWPLSDASALFPLMFLGTEYLVSNREYRGFALLFPVCTLSFLAGHPESTFVGGFGLGMYVVFRLLLARRGLKSAGRVTGLFFLSWAVAACVSASQLVPLLEYIRNGNSFFVEFQGAVRRPLTFCMAPLFWIQRFCGTAQEETFWGDFNSVISNPLYPGVPVVALIPLIWCRARNNPANRIHRTQSMCLSIASGVLILLAFDVPGLRCIGALPLIHLILIHHFIIFPLFALTVLAALGLERWLSQPRKLREVTWCLPPFLLGIVVTVATIVLWRGQLAAAQRESYVCHQILIASGFVAITLAVLALSTWRGWSRWAAGVLVLVLAVDLLYANRGFNPSIAREHIVPDTALTRYLHSIPDSGPIDMYDTYIPTGFMVAYGLKALWTIDALMPTRLYRWLSRLDLHGMAFEPPVAPLVLRDPLVKSASAARYKDLERLATLDGIEVYRNPQAIPRVLLVGGVETVPDLEAERICTMTADDMRNIVLTDRPPSAPLPRTPGQPAGDARILREQSTRIEIEANARIPAALVLCDSFYPGWHAAVDGRPAEVFPADYVFRGVLLDAGNHRVVFTYAPWSFPIGMAVSLVTIGLLVAVGMIRLGRARACMATSRHPVTR